MNQFRSGGIILGPKRNRRKKLRTKWEWDRTTAYLLLIAVVLIAFVVFEVVIRLLRQTTMSPPLPAFALPQTSDIEWNEEWPRLVITGFPARSLAEIRAAYAFAARRPEVLQSLPCFCGCKRQGHEGNEACYVKGRSAAGVPRWTDHAVTCGMCVDITHDAIVMTDDHQPVDAIRRAIEMKYR